MQRRQFLQLNAYSGAALILSFHLPSSGLSRRLFSAVPTRYFAPNAFLEIAPDSTVKIWCARSEMGQGVRTSLPMIVAEELGCDWSRVLVLQADLDPQYGDQLTGGSGSVRGGYADLRKAGAAAREMLLSAAAAQWNVPPSQCHAENAFVIHPATNRKLAFGKLDPNQFGVPSLGHVDFFRSSRAAAWPIALDWLRDGQTDRVPKEHG